MADEMKRGYQKYKVPIAVGDIPYDIATIEGKPVDLGYDGFEFFIHRPYKGNPKHWHISEKTTGHTIKIDGYTTHKGIMFIVKDSIDAVGGLPKFKKLIKRGLETNKKLFGQSIMNKGVNDE